MEYATTVTHRGVVIGYDEERNKWFFELDGRERKAETLANAKKAIDAPERKTVVPFEKFEAYNANSWSSEPEKVTVTSFTDDSREAWVIKSGGKRGKESLKDLFLITDHNTGVFKKEKALQAEAEVISRKLREVRAQRIPLQAPQEA